jgi:hypothetical protein
VEAQKDTDRKEVPKGSQHKIHILTSPSLLPVGTRCLVEQDLEEYPKGSVIYDGRIDKATDEGIKLVVFSIKRKPRVGGANAGEVIWIPAERIRFVEVGADLTKPSRN